MKRTLNTILFLFAALTMVAQNSFVVADKNGNSQLVQSLIFQQQQNADRFTWKADGTNTGDIKDLLFVARAQAELATASSNEVIEMLEELSGTDQADAEGIAATLNSNPNVEEASSVDGDNVVVKNKGDNGFVIYPLYEDMAPFSDLQEPDMSAFSKPKRSPRKSSRQYPKVAIFNFFDDMPEYKVQNTIVNSVDLYFYSNGYDVEYYTPTSVDNDRKFTYANLASVVQSSRNYAAIIIMSHGAQAEKGKSYFCTGELARSADDNRLYNWTDGKYYKCFSTGLQPESNCILYLGVCGGLASDGFSSTSPVIGYSGKTIMAQANAAMLFYLMLEEGYSLKSALNCLPSEPSPNQNTKIYKSNKVSSQTLESDTPSEREYLQGCSVNYSVINKNESSVVAGSFSANSDKMPFFAWVEFVPIIWYDVDWKETYYDYKYPWLKSPTNVVNGTFSTNFLLKGLPESIYICRITGLTKNKEKKLIKPSQYKFRICSENYQENSADIEFTEEDVSVPNILSSEGKPLEEISVAAGISQTYQIDAYFGHTFETPCLDKSVCTVSLSGTTLTVTGVSEGSTYIGIYDVQSRKMAVAQVTVTAGGGDIPSYTSCPDDNHPHLIDLGLPSGTLWACCNVGASKPEDYGGYYAWGETEEKDYYYWDTYIHCDDSYADNFHDIGNDIAGTQYDAATANWGSPWEMPNKEQMKELEDNCTIVWISENGVNGSRFTGSNGASIFLPAAGYRRFDDLGGADSEGYYWSSLLSESVTYEAYMLLIRSRNGGWGSDLRDCGLSVRPVVKN